MPRTHEGLYCQACTTVVRDFRNYNHRELSRALFSKGKICGIYTPSQLNQVYVRPRRALFARWRSVTATLLAGLTSVPAPLSAGMGGSVSAVDIKEQGPNRERVKGRVVSASYATPLAGARVYFEGYPNSFAVANSEGYFSLRLPVADEEAQALHLVVTAEGYIESRFPFSSYAIGDLPLQELKNWLTLRGTARDDSTGGLLPNVTIMALEGRVQTDSAGKFELKVKNWKPGDSVLVRATRVGAATVDKNILPAGTLPDSLHFRLRNDQQFAILVFDTVNLKIIHPEIYIVGALPLEFFKFQQPNILQAYLIQPVQVFFRNILQWQHPFARKGLATRMNGPKIER